MNYHNPWENVIDERLSHIRDRGLFREFREIESGTKPILFYKGKEMVNLSSNNYLGLSNHPLILKEITKAVTETGNPSSRLIVGHDQKTAHLEHEIAKHNHTEKALLFPNGYMMNLGVLSSILRPGDAVFSDQFNHASIVDGIKLSGAKSYRYRHCNLSHLETLLKTATNKGIKRKLIITETVFSMDGDISPLKDIVDLKNKYGALLITDDAHGAGVFGEKGEGILHELGLHNEVDLLMGTFSKAFGVYGAYVAGSKKWIQYLVNTCRSLIYTTALPPYVVHGIYKALTLIQDSASAREELKEKSTYLRTKLQNSGFRTCGSTQIIPIILGDEMKTLSFSQKLQHENILAIPIRPPTVPKETSRIRCTMMATIPWDTLRNTVYHIIKVGKETGVIS